MTPAAHLQIWVDAQTATASGKLTKLNTQMKASEAQANKSSNAIGGRLSKAMKVAGTVGAAGLAYGMYKSAKVAAQFEKQLDSTGAVANANAKQLKALEQQAIKTGQATFYSANETAKAQEELVKGGLSVRQVLGGALPAALSLAEAGQLDLATASETTVNAMKLFGLQGKDASKIADMLATAANRTTADVSDFAMALKQGGSVAKLAGLSFNNTVTILEALAESGIKNSDAGTSMKTSLIQLLKPTEKQAKLAELLGIEWTTQAGTIKTAAGLSKELRSATDGMTKAERAKTLATLAGTDGVRTLNALYDAGPKKLQVLEQANNKQGTAQEIARKKMDNFAGQIEQFKGSIETLEIKVGQLLLPTLKKLAAGATDAANEVSDVFSDKSLSNSDKFAKAFEIVTGRVSDLIAAAIPKLAEGAAAAGPKIVTAFGRGLANAWSSMDLFGKLLTGATLMRVVGGKGALLASGASIGRFLGIGVSAGASTGLVGGAGAGASAGLAGGILGALKGVKWARIGGLGIGLALADQTIEEFSLRAKAKSDDLGEALKGASGLGVWNTLEHAPIIGGLGFMKDEEKAATNLSAEYGEMAEKRVRISLATEENLRKQASELDLSKKATQQLSSMLDLMRTGRNLGVKVDLGMDPKKLQLLGAGFSTLRSGVLTSMGDINKVVQRNSQLVASSLPKGSQEAREKVAQNFRAAAVAIGQAMANGDISIKQGLERQKELFRNANLLTGDDPLSIAAGFKRSWAKAGGISDQQRQHVIADLGKMAPAARQKAFESMVRFGQGLVAGGKIPKQDLRDFKSASLAEFGDLKKKGVQSSLDLAIGISGNFGSMGSAVGNVLEILKENTNNSLGAFGAKPLTFAIKAVRHWLGDGGKQKKQSGGAIVPGSGSGDTHHTTLPIGSFVMNREATKAFGLAKGGMMPVALEPGERRFLPAEVAKHGAKNLEAMNQAVPRFQKGGRLGSEPQISGPAGPLRDMGQGAIGKTYEAAKEFLAKHKPKSSGAVGGYTGPPADMKQLGDNRYVDSHTLAVTALVDKMFGLQMTDGYRNAATAEQYPSGLGTLHHDGTPSNPGATDSAGPMGQMQKALAWSKSHIAGLLEAQIDNVAGWNMHLGFFKKGGLLQRLAEGGFAGDGYTVKGNAATSQQMRTAAEIMEAADKTGASHLPRVASMMAATQESNMGSAGNTFQLTGDFEGVSPSDRAYIQAVQWFTKGYWHGGGIGLSKKFSDPGDIAQEVEGSAYPNAYDPWKREAQTWTDGWGGKNSDEHSFKEDVPAVYKGARTGSLNLPSSTPKSLEGIKKELHKRQGELKIYRRAAADAHAKDKPKVEQAITQNIRGLETRIRELERAKALARREAAKRKISKRFGKALGALTGFEDLISARERSFDAKNQYAEQVVALEPLMPEVPEKATNAQREAIEKAHIDNLTGYIKGEEEPAYQALLGSAGEWRNTILTAQGKAVVLEGGWEDKIIAARNEIDHDNDFIKKVGERVAEWKHENGKDQFPDWLKGQIEKQHEVRAHLPILRFTEQELRKVLGEGRAEFYPGKARITNPDPPFAGSGSLEEALQTVQGIHWPGQHEKLSSLPAVRAAGQFGGVIWDVQTSLSELGLKLGEAKVQGGEGGEEGAGDSEAAEFWKEQTRLANLRNLVFERQNPIVNAYMGKYAGAFAKGGSIPAGMWGIAGETGRPEVIQGPASVVDPAMSAGMLGAATTSSVSVIVEDGAVDSGRIRVIAADERRRGQRRSGRMIRSIGARKAGRLN